MNALAALVASAAHENGYCSYVRTVESFKHGGYETYRTVYTSRLAKDAGDRILQNSIDHLRVLHEPLNSTRLD